MHQSRVRGAVVVGLATVGLLAGGSERARAQDFNGDGFHDAAIGAPGESFGVIAAGGGAARSGAVTILYGSGPGIGLRPLGPLPAMFITEATFGLDLPEAGDLFGAALAWGDFDRDGFDDLAIAAPGESHPIIGAPGAGMVVILYGSPGGLFPKFPPLLAQDPPLGGPPLGEPAEAGDQFGRALAAGDFNADGFVDLAIGVPGEDLPGGGPIDAGIVHVLYGSPVGLMLGPGIPILWQGGLPWGDPSEPGDRFGRTLAAGDLDGDGTADLAIGVPYENFAGQADTGMVNVIYGLWGPGLVPFGLTETWTENTFGVPAGCRPGDRFGSALSIGDFDRAAGEDLAIGVPYKDIAGVVDCGAVIVIYSAGAGLGLEAIAPPAPQPAELWHQNVAGVPGTNAANDHFGSALAAGDFRGDLCTDLVIGVPQDDVVPGPVANAGSVIVLHGNKAPRGLDAFVPVPAQFWSQNSPGIPDSAQWGDKFGHALTVGDFDGDQIFDLVIGVPDEDSFGGIFADVGCIHVIYGLPALGLSAFGPIPAQFWDQNSFAMPDVSEPGDQFGGALDNDD